MASCIGYFFQKIIVNDELSMVNCEQLIINRSQFTIINQQTGNLMTISHRNQLWVNLRAVVKGGGAARVKAAAGRKVDGVGRVAF
jgi:hypothetical protein